MIVFSLTEDTQGRKRERKYTHPQFHKTETQYAAAECSPIQSDGVCTRFLKILTTDSSGFTLLKLRPNNSMNCQTNYDC